MIKINVLTIFPEIITEYFKYGILSRACAENIISINVINIRDFAHDKYKKVDDIPYGGGAGMVMKPEPLFEAVASLKLKKNSRVLLTTPAGKLFNQSMAKELAQEEELTIICGRYEGIDERINEALVTDEISTGEYVLSGGELPALTIVDALARMIPGVVGNQASVENDSFYNNNELDYPQYTRPEEYQGMKVPKLLLNGNHKEIDEWRQKQAKARKKSQK